MTEREREIFETAAGFLRELSPVCLINLSYNLDCYSFYPGVFTVGSHTVADFMSCHQTALMSCL